MTQQGIEPWSLRTYQQGPNRWATGEREIDISPWLHVHVTGPRHHLASGLRSWVMREESEESSTQQAFRELPICAR